MRENLRCKFGETLPCIPLVSHPLFIPDMDMRVILKALGGIRGQMNRLESNVATVQANQGKMLHHAEVTPLFLWGFHI